MQHPRPTPLPPACRSDQELLLSWQQPHPVQSQAQGVWTVSEAGAAADARPASAAALRLRVPRRLIVHTPARTLQALLRRPLPTRGPAAIAGQLLAAARQAGEDAQADAALLAAIAALVDQALAAEAEACGIVGAATSDDEQRCRLQAYLLDRLADRALSMDRVAEAFGMSRRSLYKLFERWGTTPRAFLHNAKLDRACQLLRDAAAAPVGRIAAECGFSDPAHFSRAFQARHGTAPSAWRAMQA